MLHTLRPVVSGSTATSRPTDTRGLAHRSTALLLLALLILSLAAALGDEDPDKPPRYRARPAPTRQPTARVLPAPQSRPDRISITFSNVDVRDALVRIAQYAGVDVLLAPGATGSVSINLRERTPEEAIRMLAASAGLYVTQAQGAFIVGSASEIQRAVTEFGLTEVVALQHAKPEDAATFLSKAVPTVKVEATATGISITGLLEDLRRAREALRSFDVPPPEVPEREETILVTIEKANPEQAEAVLRKAFPSLNVSREDRVLVLNGPAGLIQAADRAVRAIDVPAPTEPETTEVAVYPLRYLHARRAETALKAIFPDLKVAASPEPNMPPTAQFFPLTTGAFGTTGAGGAGGGFGAGGGMGAGGVGVGGTGVGGAGGEGVGGFAGPAFTRSTSLILAGRSSEVRAAVEALEKMDVPQPSVRIDAALVEVTQDGLKELGVEWSWQDGNFKFAQTTGLQAEVATSTVNVSSFTAKLRALVTSKKANLLANPNILCVDNEDASIFIGELRRYRGGTVVTPGIGTVQSTEVVPVGVALLVRPRIHPDGNVTLKVHPVVSTVLGLVDGLPQTASREADTTVRLREGEELIIGGLYRTEHTQTAEKIPLLGDLPLIGALFRTSNTIKNKTEIVVVIRVYPVLPNPAPARDFQKGVAP